MARKVLITGTQDLLARSLATRYRVDSDNLVMQVPTKIEETRTRVDDIWWLYGGQNDMNPITNLLNLLPILGTRTFHFVGPMPADLITAVVECCTSAQIQCRIYHIPHLLGADIQVEECHCSLNQFLNIVDDVITEVAERRPGYFQRQPLRLQVPADTLVDLTGADKVANTLLSIQQVSPVGYHHLMVERPTRFTDLCAIMGLVWNLDLTVVTKESEFNAVDRYLQDRLVGIELLERASIDRSGFTSHRVGHLDNETQHTHLLAFRNRVAASRAAVQAKVVVLPQRLERHTINELPGFEYFSIGWGDPPLVVINAIGQGLTIWLPLLERLSRKRRVIIWEMRQTDPQGRSITFSEHCDDLHAVLQAANAKQSHLLGWCTGAKLAARYCRTHPGSVQTMVFLSGSFKHPERAPALDTAYERNLEAMCQAVVQQPSLANRLCVVFNSESSDTNEHSNGNALLLQALHPDLGPEVRRPFREESSMIIYAQQHVEFWSHNETDIGSTIGIPVLGIAGEYDQVVSPKGFQLALNHFPQACFVNVSGATHYCFYDRPDHVANLIEDFLPDVLSRQDSYRLASPTISQQCLIKDVLKAT